MLWIAVRLRCCCESDQCSTFRPETIIFYWFINCPIAIASFCLSVRDHIRFAIFARFWWNFAQKFGARKVRMLSLGGQNSMTPSPILPQLFTPIMHFQWEDQTTAVTKPVDWLWRLRAQTTCLGGGYKHKVAKCCNPCNPNLPLKHKNGDQCIFNWNVLGEVFDT